MIRGMTESGTQHESTGRETSPAIEAAKQRFLQELGEKGWQLEPGIAQAVTMLNLSGITTTESCEGHLEAEGVDVTLPWTDLIRREGVLIGAPWVTFEIAHETFDSEQAQQLAYGRKCFELEGRMVELLDGFYATRQVPADVRLYFYGDGSYELASQGGALLQYPQGMDRTVRAQKLEQYRTEMREFATFLEQRLALEG